MVRPEIKLLLVEDNKADQFLIETYLSYSKENFFSLIFANTLSEATGFLKHNKFDIALVDHYLPDGTGSEFAKRNASCLEMPLIMLSRSMPETAYENMIQCGIYDFIPKVKMGPILLEKVIKFAMRRSKRKKRFEISKVKYIYGQMGFFD